MTTSGTETRAAQQWLGHGGAPVRIITWATRLVGLLASVSVIFPITREKLRHPVARWLDLPLEATVAAEVITVAAGIGFLLLASCLRRTKRRAWQIAVLTSGLTAALQVVFDHRL